MAYPSIIAADVMDAVASLMNDTAKSVYTYTVQIPYLNMALRELQEYYELNEVPVTDTFSAVMSCPAGTTSISFGGTPALPTDLVEPSVLWERPTGIDPYVPMTRVKFLPRQLSGILTPQFLVYVWESQEIRFLEANQDNDIRMDYIRFLFTTVSASTDPISVINTQSFLQFRTAGLCAEFVAENKTRADSLNGDAILSLDRALGIGAKGRQTMMTRHRPFRSSFKRRSYF